MSTFHFLILSVPLYFRFDNEELFEFNKMILVYALTVFIGLFWAVRMIVEKKIYFKRTPFDIPLALFVISQLLSTIFSIHQYTSLWGYYSRFHGGLLSTLCYVFLFYAFVSNTSKKDLGGIFLSSLISGFLVSLYGILEHFGHSVSCLLAPGNTPSFGVDCWVQKVQERVFATFGQPNWLASYVVMLLPVSFILSVQAKLSVSKRVFFIFCSLALFLVLLYTRSRSGFLAFCMSFGIILLGFLFLYKNHGTELQKKIHFPTLFATFFLFIAFTMQVGTSFTPQFSQVLNRFSNQPKEETQTQLETTAPSANRLEEGGTDSGEIRKIVWQGAIKIWQRYPVFGSGVETFAYSYYQDRIREHNDVSEWDFLYNKAHNELLNILATSGIVGLVTYLSIFAVFAYQALKSFFSARELSSTEFGLIALSTSFVGFFVTNFFGFSTVAMSVLFFLFLALSTHLFSTNQNGIFSCKTSNKITESASKKPQTSFSKVSIQNPQLSSPQYFGISVTIIIALLILLRIYNYWSADALYAQGKHYFSAGQYQLAIEKLLDAIQKSPQEALYYDTLSDYYAKLSAHFAASDQETVATQLADEALRASDATLLLNNRHLNFYKTRTRVLITLSEIDPSSLEEAKKTIIRAKELSPTDPKLPYNLAVIEQSMGNVESALPLYEQAIALKPNYEQAYWKAIEIYEMQKNYAQAVALLEKILDIIDPQHQTAIGKKASLIKIIQEEN